MRFLKTMIDMARGKFYTTTELAEIKGYLKDGCSYEEIAELMGRSKKSIENTIQRQGWTRGRFNNNAVELPVQKQTIVEQDPVKEKTLKDFPAREMIKYLYNLGYRIEDNKLVCYVKQAVNVKDIING